MDEINNPTGQRNDPTKYDGADFHSKIRDLEPEITHPTFAWF
jgi:hypothetical protein